MRNPFARKRPNPKRIEPRRTGDRVRLYGEEKTTLRVFVYQRAAGRCERESRTGKPHHPDCPGFANFHDGHLAHVQHGPRKTDTPEGTYWASAVCHSIEDHNPKSVPRKPGRRMNQTEAVAYWKGTKCWCGKEEKASGYSFGPTCWAKLSPQSQYDLLNTLGEDYIQAIALAEIEVLAWKPAEEKVSS